MRAALLRAISHTTPARHYTFAEALTESEQEAIFAEALKAVCSDDAVDHAVFLAMCNWKNLAVFVSYLSFFQIFES